MLTGRLPFDGTALQLLMDKTGRDAPDLRVVAPDAPAIARLGELGVARADRFAAMWAPR